MKLLILVLGSYDPVSVNLIENGIKETWGRDVTNDIDILFYWGGHEKNEIVNQDLFLTSPDAYGAAMIQKTLDAFQYVYDNLEFDILYRTNISSYIRTRLLYSIFSEYKNISNFFSSTLPQEQQPQFTGIGMAFSKDVIKLILDHKHIDTPFWGEDNAIEFILQHIYKDEYSSKLYNFDRCDILYGTEALEDPLFKIKNSKFFQFRCKTINGNRSMDVQKMKKLHKIFTN